VSFREYSLYSAFLTLHNSTLYPNNNPYADMRPIGRKRDKKTITSKAKANKRSYKASVAKIIKRKAD
jgi:hypothetical protein